MRSVLCNESNAPLCLGMGRYWYPGGPWDRLWKNLTATMEKELRKLRARAAVDPREPAREWEAFVEARRRRNNVRLFLRNSRLGHEKAKDEMDAMELEMFYTRKPRKDQKAEAETDLAKELEEAFRDWKF